MTTTTTTLIPVHRNHYQESGSNWQCISATMTMVEEDYSHDYKDYPNTNVGDGSLMKDLPEWVQNHLWQQGGRVEWEEIYSTMTWEGQGTTEVFSQDNQLIFSDSYECQK